MSRLLASKSFLSALALLGLALGAPQAHAASAPLALNEVGVFRPSGGLERFQKENQLKLEREPKRHRWEEPEAVDLRVLSRIQERLYLPKNVLIAPGLGLEPGPGEDQRPDDLAQVVGIQLWFVF